MFYIPFSGWTAEMNVMNSVETFFRPTNEVREVLAVKYDKKFKSRVTYCTLNPGTFICVENLYRGFTVCMVEYYIDTKKFGVI